MIELQIENLFVVQNQLERLGRGLNDNRYLLMRRLAGTMATAVAQNFKQSGRPKWLGLAYRNGKPLVDTGALKGSITEMADNDTALVGTNWVLLRKPRVSAKFPNCVAHSRTNFDGH